MLTTINHIPKAGMIAKFSQPYFGYTVNYPDGRSEVWLRDDLPERVQQSVKIHEMQHVKDRAFLDGRVWYWEFRAWNTQFKADFIGTLQTVWLSITDIDRIKMYLNRIIKGF